MGSDQIRNIINPPVVHIAGPGWKGAACLRPLGEDPNLELEAEFNLKPFMPELALYRYFYGSFEGSIEDLKVFRVVP